jgi:DNA-binding IclR family transcriptional regulator
MFIVYAQFILYIDNMVKRNESGVDLTAPRPVPAVTRGIAILRFLARCNEPVGVNAIARAVGIIPSTCLHILRALVAEEMVSVDPVTKGYTLDAGVVTLARSALRQDGFANLVQGDLDRIAAQYGITAIGVRVIGLQHMIVVAISRSDMTFRLHVDIGSRFPALISATGRCLAAFGGFEESDLKRRFQALRWDDAPPYEAWRKEVEATWRTGVGIDAGNYIRGVTILAAPVLGIEGRMTHGVVAVGLSDQMRHVGHDTVGADLKSVADKLTTQLGGTSRTRTAVGSTS